MTIGFRSISSLSAQKDLGQANADLKTSYERLSSGLRINSASDDAAGLAVASKLNVASRVFTQAIRNISDGQSVLNIAEGALHQLSAITTRQTELAEQSANGAYSGVQRKALQTEADALTNEFNRIVKTTSFNGQAILDVNNSAGTIQIQAGFGINNSLSFSTGNELARNVGSGTFDSGQTIFVGTSFVETAEIGDLNGDGYNDIVVFREDGNGGPLALLANSDGTFSAPTTIELPGLGSDFFSAKLVDINGDGALDVVATAGVTGTDIFYALGNGNGTFKAKVDTGIAGNTFQFGDTDGDGRPELLNFDGTNYTLYHNAGNGSFTSPITYTAPPSYYASLTDINGDGKKEVNISSLSYGYADFNGDGLDDRYYVGSALLVSYGDGHGTFGSTQILNGGFHGLGSLADLNDDGVLDVIGRASDANFISQSNGTYRSTDGPIRTVSVIGDLNGDGAPDAIAVDSVAGSMTIYHQHADSKTSVIRSPKISSQIDARNALRGLAAQQQRVESQLGVIGSAQSRLQTASSNLTTLNEGYIESSARITDVDVAAETSNLVRNEIKQQVAASILHSANLEPELVLKLLRNS